MRILYIQRAPDPLPWKERLRSRVSGRLLTGQDGFFEAALWTAFPGMKTCALEEAGRMVESIDNEFDWIVVNFKCAPDAKGVKPEAVAWLDKLRKCRKALFLNQARAWKLGTSDLLRRFDVIFKRELLKDLERYDVEDSIRSRLYGTMLSCPLVEIRRRRSGRLVRREPALPCDGVVPGPVVSFVGADSNPLRRELLRLLPHEAGFFQGGLYGRDGRPLDWDGPSCRAMKPASYVNLIRGTRVNLALDGIGGFTFRHLEIWLLGAFMLSTPSIHDVRLPGEDPVEGVHYAVFSGKDDLMDKVRYYAEHDSERQRMATEGRRLFESIYDISRHAGFVSSVLEKNR